MNVYFLQAYKKIEIIIIDDGSSDASAKICDEYIQDDESCIVFHKMNAGGASARQVGLMSISGEYVIHADPDDWTDLTFLDKIYEVAKNDNADMVLGSFYRNYPDGTQLFFKNKPSSLDYETVLFSSFTYLNGSCWNKLIKRSVIKNIILCDSLAYREDR